MAGHSKWANIKHRKGKQDAVRSKIFTKLQREIMVAAKEGGPILENNAKLRLAVDRANQNNMPKDRIQRTIDKYGHDKSSDDMDRICYEGYAPSGVAVFVECLTDNRNRTVSEVRHAFTKYGGSLGTDGSVAYMFCRKGIIGLTDISDQDALLELVIEADDVVTDSDEETIVLTAPEQYEPVLQALKDAEYTVAHSDVRLIPDNEVQIEGEQVEKVQRLLDALDDLDDVQTVTSNAVFEEVTNEE